MFKYFRLLKNKGFSYCFKQIKRRFFVNDEQMRGLLCYLGVYDYVQKYKYVLNEDEYAKIQEINIENPYPDKIWVCWLQGVENAPDLVRKCINTIIEHADGYEVIVLNRDNVFDYVELPDYIIKKWEKGIISNTHFSDIVRLTLLVQHGGVWVDSTSYMTDKIPEYIRNSELFCFSSSVGKMVASNWFIVAKPYNKIIWETQKLICEYWRKENRLVSYMIFHAFFAIAVESSSSSKKLWKEVPYISDLNAKMLQWELFSLYDEKKLKEVCQFSFVQKLSYKFSDEQLQKSGTFYDVLINGVNMTIV